MAVHWEHAGSKGAVLPMDVVELADIGVAVHTGAEGQVEDADVVFDQLHGVQAICSCGCRGG